MKGRQIVEISGEALRFAFGVAGAAAAMRGPFPNPEQFGFSIAEDGGKVTDYSLTDGPMNRARWLSRRT